MSGVTQTVTWTDLDAQRHHLQRRRQHPDQRSRPAHGQLRPGDQPARSGPGARLQLGVQRRPAARTVAARVGDRRLLSPRLLQPPGQRQPECGAERLVGAFSINTPTDPRLPLSGQPIPLYTLNADQGRRRDRHTWSPTRPQTRRPTTASSSPPTCGATSSSSSAASPPTSGRRLPATATPRATTARDNPNGAPVLRRGPAVPHDGQGVRRLLVPVRHQPERIVHRRFPGPSVNANYTVTSAIAGRPIIGIDRRRYVHRRQPGPAGTRCSSTTRTGWTCASARRSGSTARRSRASWTSSTSSTPARR